MNNCRRSSRKRGSVRHWHNPPLLLLVCLSMIGLAFQTACITVVDEKATREMRMARRVDVTSQGRIIFEGEQLSLDKLARRLKKGKSSHRAVALFGAEGCSRSTLVNIQRQLVQKGVPNISIVIPRRAYAEVLDEDSYE